MTITAISGIRNLSPASYADVELVVIEEATLVDELRFGGAIGVDTIALRAACGDDESAYRQVIVPFEVVDQPAEAAKTIQDCADEIIEMHLLRSREAFLRRNDRLLEGADRLLAFTDGRTSGGTWYTIQSAIKRGLDVVIVPVESDQGKPTLAGEDRSQSLPARVFWHKPYSSTGSASILIRQMKRGNASVYAIEQLAAELAILCQKEIPPFDVIIAVPRRVPGIPSDLEPLAEALAIRLGVKHIPGFLIRIEEPKHGIFIQAGRQRFPADEHYRTMTVAGPLAGRVLILDNVLTTGGTMEGALRRIIDSTQAQVVGLAVLVAQSRPTP